MDITNFDFEEVDGVQTMSSVILAELCYGAKYTKTSHKDFMKKALKVLGEEQVGNFSYQSEYDKGNGATGVRTVLKLPERESILMAMSYSYELQAQVYDAWVSQREALVRIVASASHEEAVDIAKAELTEREILIAEVIKGNKEGISIGKRVSKALQLSLHNTSEMTDTLIQISKGMNKVQSQTREGFWMSTRTTVDNLRDKYRRTADDFSPDVYRDYEKVMHYCTKRIAQCRAHTNKTNTHKE